MCSAIIPSLQWVFWTIDHSCSVVNYCVSISNFFAACTSFSIIIVFFWIFLLNAWFAPQSQKTLMPSSGCINLGFLQKILLSPSVFYVCSQANKNLFSRADVEWKMEVIATILVGCLLVLSAIIALFIMHRSRSSQHFPSKVGYINIVQLGPSTKANLCLLTKYKLTLKLCHRKRFWGF